IELCGHATLASAAVIWRENLENPHHPIIFDTRNGVFTVFQTPPLIHLKFPLMPPTPVACPGELMDCIGLIPDDLAYTGKNQSDWLIELQNPHRLSMLQPDFQRLENLLTGGIIITSPDPSGVYDFISRYFDPAEGINEDPVTGSAHCCLGPYWQSRLDKNSLLACQISERGGVLHLTLFSDHIDIAGQVAFFMEGRIL
ncbi:MAG: PhzF family phenazine biosynthesis protein, partial [Candidatus Delongbacteria bacterium]|nr:PhzF family phenazine biosynthesis protein [Candidatus Delongbacteria bacterium]